LHRNLQLPCHLERSHTTRKKPIRGVQNLASRGVLLYATDTTPLIQGYPWRTRCTPWLSFLPVAYTNLCSTNMSQARGVYNCVRHHYTTKFQKKRSRSGVHRKSRFIIYYMQFCTEHPKRKLKKQSGHVARTSRRRPPCATPSVTMCVHAGEKASSGAAVSPSFAYLLSGSQGDGRRLLRLLLRLHLARPRSTTPSLPPQWPTAVLSAKLRAAVAGGRPCRPAPSPSSALTPSLSPKSERS
jgi:hypothetical protein